MGENLAVEGRFAVRTPMQWKAGDGAGFSPADPAAFPGPITEGRYGPDHVNVQAQERDPASLLAYVRRLVRAYRDCPELAWGKYTVLDPGAGARPVLAHRSDCEGHAVVALHSFGDRDTEAALTLTDLAGRTLTDVLDLTAEPLTVPEDGALDVPLEPYGSRWLRTGEPE